MTDQRSFESLLDDYLTYFKEHPINGTTELLYEPANYILSLGGKRVRPLLCLMGYRLFRDNTDTALPLAHALEVFHNFTLIHDDIIDQAPLRRGKETAHIRWNVNQAILTGDVMLVKAYELFTDLKTSDSNKIKLIRGFNQMADEVCQGQQLDWEFSSMPHVSESDYIEMIRLKTSVLLGFCLYAGAVLAGASDREAGILYEYGVLNGISFQIIDDILDAFGDAEVGKQPGGDILENKKTILLIELLHRVEGEDVMAVNHLLVDDQIQSEQKVERMLQFYREYEIEAYARERADQFRHKAESLIQQLESVDTTQLKTFMAALHQRMK